MNIAIDVDAVIRDFTSSLTEVYLREHPEHLHEITPIDTWDLDPHFPIGKDIYKFAFEDFAYDIFLVYAHAYPDAHASINYLIGKGHNLTALTVQNETTKKYTERWLRLNGFLFNDIVYVSHEDNHTGKGKETYNFDLFIDDSPHNIINIREAGKNIVCYNQPWNINWDFKGGIKRVNNLIEFTKYVDFLTE